MHFSQTWHSNGHEPPTLLSGNFWCTLRIRGIHLVPRAVSMRSHVPTAMSLMAAKQGEALRQDLMNIRKKLKKSWESKRNFTRQARKQSESEQSKSAIADHTVQDNHIINWQDAKILAKECVLDVRHIKEAIWIRRHARCTKHDEQRRTGPLSKSRIWSCSGHAYFRWSSEQKRWSSTIIMMKCVDLNTWNCHHK